MTWRAISTRPYREANVVIRLNAGPTRGFERHVGSRTDLRLVNRLHMGFRELNDETVRRCRNHAACAVALHPHIPCHHHLFELPSPVLVQLSQASPFWLLIR